MRPLLLTACLALALAAAPAFAQSVALKGPDGHTATLEGDVRPACSARMVTTIAVRRLGSTPPAAAHVH